MQKIRKGDEVIVIAGKDKGKQGKVLKVYPQKERVVVEGVQLLKHYVRANPQTKEEGGVFDKEGTIHISNIALFNPSTKKPGKIAIKLIKTEGEKVKRVRVFKSTQQEVGEENG
ncbi:MAG: 50S ribosomal protein L24 [uncultured bacterium]|nr:MAG: 50S ribosomal protein L24 [uncultured bacterium]OGT16847.1 MAG: 50S ribosomal protein L24 [Gammaproteobacteria bacterium RIFCSPHIGHO2_02_FULL_38_33]OGT23907.1 MAG: 50S ribosomal protein L24 [Gammaproteobacteria bacterium RIFCSPHIGHO2_12_38_15]OGT67125.1 MAG: 50S ribosomal protein L24 [Gammaproteobacteria bacterium RIFCSPLOWO2_02_FULL_38_11]OGT76120.1 MAG: 50S ribosomal protein L24 [Gammaproteobacteria bacterium RIFCSPLOWO2_12_FULL_38_14]